MMLLLPKVMILTVDLKSIASEISFNRARPLIEISQYKSDHIQLFSRAKTLILSRRAMPTIRTCPWHNQVILRREKRKKVASCTYCSSSTAVWHLIIFWHCMVCPGQEQASKQHAIVATNWNIGRLSLPVQGVVVRIAVRIIVILFIHFLAGFDEGCPPKFAFSIRLCFLYAGYALFLTPRFFGQNVHVCKCPLYIETFPSDNRFHRFFVAEWAYL